MEKIIYHGSESRIERPVHGLGEKYNDYGLGFYCTESLNMAKEWASSPERDGFANAYALDMTDLQIMDLNSAEYLLIHWLTLLIQNRNFRAGSVLAREAKEYLIGNFSPDLTGVDLIIGYRADDSYFSFAEDFLNGTISYRQLNNAMRLGKLGQQIVLKSRKAYSQITFLKAYPVQSKEWYEKRMLRDKAARRQYFDFERNRRMRGDLYITTILDEEMKADDPRLR